MVQKERSKCNKSYFFNMARIHEKTSPFLPEMYKRQISDTILKN